MSKSKHAAQWKIEIAKKHLSGEGSYSKNIKLDTLLKQNSCHHNGSSCLQYF